MTLESDLVATAQTLRSQARGGLRRVRDAEAMSRFWFTRRDDGLRAGETVTWYLGPEPDALPVETRVTSLERPRLIVMEGENAGGFTTVTWTFEEKGPNTTLLRVEETGYSADPQTNLAAVLESIGGFNKVLLTRVGSIPELRCALVPQVALRRSRSASLTPMSGAQRSVCPLPRSPGRRPA